MIHNACEINLRIVWLNLFCGLMEFFSGISNACYSSIMENIPICCFFRFWLAVFISFCSACSQWKDKKDSDNVDCETWFNMWRLLNFQGNFECWAIYIYKHLLVQKKEFVLHKEKRAGTRFRNAKKNNKAPEEKALGNWPIKKSWNTKSSMKN